MFLPLQHSVQEVGRRAVLAGQNARGARHEQGGGTGHNKMTAFLNVCMQSNKCRILSTSLHNRRKTPK